MRRSFLIGAGVAAILGFLLLRKSGSSAPPGPRRVVALGDSWTADPGYSWELQRLLNADGKHQGSTVRNLGVVGQGIAQVHARLSQAVALQPTDLIVMAGINDLPGGDVAEMKMQLDVLLKDARARLPNARLVVVQMPPSLGYSSLLGRQEAWEAVNSWILGSSIPDVAVETESLGDSLHRLLPAVDSGDKLHSNANGQRMLGRLIFDAAFGG
jgi:lysophospholipase L1-like esterase